MAKVILLLLLQISVEVTIGVRTVD